MSWEQCCKYVRETSDIICECALFDGWIFSQLVVFPKLLQRRRKVSAFKLDIII